jgi:NADP-dependent 3-hydroxy acid dehydrogenase YdfG
MRRESVRGMVFANLDGRIEADWEWAVNVALEHFQSLHILVKNAGMIIYQRFAQISTKDYLLQFQIDQLGVFLGMLVACPALKRAGGGSIINAASTTGVVAYEQQGAYAATK